MCMVSYYNLTYRVQDIAAFTGQEILQFLSHLGGTARGVVLSMVMIGDCMSVEDKHHIPLGVVCVKDFT